MSRKVEVLGDKPHRQSALANRGGDAVHGSGAGVPGGEDARHGRFQRQRLTGILSVPRKAIGNRGLAPG